MLCVVWDKQSSKLKEKKKKYENLTQKLQNSNKNYRNSLVIWSGCEQPGQGFLVECQGSGDKLKLVVTQNWNNEP